MNSIIIAIFCFCTAQAFGQTLTYQNQQDLIPGVYTLFWTADEVSQTMFFATKVKTTGWTGLGISVSGGMIGSDVVIGWIDNSNNVVFEDRRAFEKGPIPVLDSKQDWQLTNSQKTVDGFQILEFNRPFVTGDTTGDVDIRSGPTKVVFAYSDALPSSSADIQFHTERGSTQISFFGAPVFTADLNGTITADLVMGDTTIPSAATSYRCKKVAFPLVDAHIIRYEPIIVNIEKVHHMVLYNCPVDFEPSVEEGNCDQIADFAKCPEISFVWARGGEAFDLPPLAGNPIGPNVVRFAYLEMHYDNPNQQVGDKDNSGLKIYYTTAKRQFDAGVLMIGRAPAGISIPPQSKNFDVSGTCGSECTQLLPKGGIHVYGVLLHAHLLGRSIRTDIVRSGELQGGALGGLEFYDFNFQTLLNMEPHFNLLPGDAMTTHCIYDSSERREVTKGGESTTDEMCYNFLFYYPRVPAAGCVETNGGDACGAGGGVGLIVGVAVGIAVGVALIVTGVVVGVVVYKRRKNRKEKVASTELPEVN